MKRLGFIASALLGLLAACADGELVPGGACVTNQDCTSGQQCISSRCKAVSLPGCKNDDSCNIGEYCDPVDHTCKEMMIIGCNNDDPCPPQQRCNTLTGVCIDGRRSCTSEEPCARINKHCDTTLQQCVDCTEPAHCQSPTTCVENRCIDTSMGQCATDNQCAPPATVCEGLACVPGCGEAGSPVTCGLGNVCNTNTGRCVPGQVNCANDTQCSPPATICESTQCIPGCTQPGGLQCTGGFVCNATNGRCEPPSGCVNDTGCGAPAAICENSMCTPGCAQPGGVTCGAGTVCDGGTGRCVTVTGPCQTDLQCNAPVTICESGQCIGGCNQIGGIQCNGATVCNQTTGRCDPTTPGCTTDATCGPPSNICNMVTGQCTPGCGATGCTAPLVCNVGTGRCYDPGMPMGLPLNSACNANGDCASDVCFDFTPVASGVGKRCVSACGNSLECPASFTCYDFYGAEMCLSNQLFQNATFSTPNGGACTGDAQCKSFLCRSNTCMEVCQEATDCPNGQCSWREIVSDVYLAACYGNLGSGGNGAGCSSETQCQSGVCYGSGTCGSVCGSSADCPQGNVCAPVNYSVCTLDVFGTCLEWQPNFVKACVAQTHGQATMGTACSNAQGSNCRDGFCWGPTNQCTGVCSRDADCGAGMVCSIELYGDLDGTDVYLNVCRPR